MKIKDLAHSTDISISAIRYYEKIGLIHPLKNGYYKIYTKHILEQLLAIKMFKDAGFSLKNLQDIFLLQDKDPSQLERNELEQILRILEERLEKIEKQEQTLKQSRQRLERMKKKVNLYYETCK
ncbi:MAG: MerR family transcriptional regulator [Anaeroplasma bactoclasticum]|nr:MerR family transcriptional regulator [Anaeroplasma bactoclasticum]